jgi:kexin
VDNGPATINEFDASFTGIKKIEWVDATVHLNHGYWGDLLIQLYSPSGTEAILMEPHNCSDGNGTRTECQTGNMDWRFGIARFLDETAEGKFRISVQDKAVQDAGYFKKWDLTIYGRTN